jgi:hypothetical protein
MILTILAAISFSLFFVEIHQLHIKWKLNFKPFSCASCLSAWVGVILYALPDIFTNAIAVVFIPGFLTPVINKLMWKLWK